MGELPFNYLYGPVYSWRLGMSLGIDPISSSDKLCNFNCVYCQLGETSAPAADRKVYVPAGAVLDEVRRLDPGLVVDYLTFSGRGEPTLALNLGEMIFGIRKIRPEKIAVITNAGLMGDPDVRRDLMQADCVLAKLDAHDQASFDRIDRPAAGTCYMDIVEGLRVFSREFHGKFALQMMFIDENQGSAAAMARVAASVGADEIELNTPLRPCGVRPLDEAAMRKVKEAFKDVAGVTMVYERGRKIASAMDKDATVRRHGWYDQSG